MSLTIGLLAGEASGDNLAAGMMAALKVHPLMPRDVRFIGVGGPGMIAQGLEPLASIEELSVNGFKEPILRFPALWKLYRKLAEIFTEEKIDAFVGIDFNVFNFLLERRLKENGIPTAHYVSPSVYAWRRGRTKRVARSVDSLFCLFPFEPAFYSGLPVKALFVGHPLAQEISDIDSQPERQKWARSELKIQSDSVVLAVLPGSRGSEIELMLGPFLLAASIIQDKLKLRGEKLKVVIPCVNAACQTQVELGIVAFKQLDISLYQGQARMPLTASDAALVKSGTSTLEAMLLKRPMVVSYRLGYWSHWIARMLVRTEYVAMPNILSKKALVPEFLQDRAQPEALADALMEEFDKSSLDEQYFSQFARIQMLLQAGERGMGANQTSAQGLVELMRDKGKL
jgi:lipid-A-disaccharide synthase